MSLSTITNCALWEKGESNRLKLAVNMPAPVLACVRIISSQHRLYVNTSAVHNEVTALC